MGVGAHKSRRDKWVDNSTSDVTSLSNSSKPKKGTQSNVNNDLFLYVTS